jgi:hypothetical protein
MENGNSAPRADQPLMTQKDLARDNAPASIQYKNEAPRNYTQTTTRSNRDYGRRM